MATRSLTEVFILMRNNAMQSRHIYSEQHMHDRMSLVGGDVESGLELRGRGAGESRLPPAWADALEEAQYALTRLRAKLRELEALHARALQRPTLDDACEDEALVEALTGDIARMFGATHRLVQQIRRQSNEGSRQEKRLSYNVVSSLVTSLQELSNSFRKAQNTYLRKLNMREERSRQYFEQDFSPQDWELDSEVDNIDRAFGIMGGGGSLQQQQQLLLLEEENMRVAQRREQEVHQIVRSITDLNDIFKDLAHMVADQGTVLDRIDYNIEQTQTQVHQGYQQLQKAENYQKKNRKIVCILVLAVTTLILLVLLIILKS